MKSDLPLVFLVSFVVGMGSSIAIKRYTKAHRPPPVEFVCYTDGKLTERHVGVASAGLYGNTGKFYIRYVEGNKVYYTPKPGESCGIEEVR